MLRANTFIVTNTNGSGKGSLKQALMEANAHKGKDIITFRLDKKSDWNVIRFNNEWLNVLDDLVIDGFNTDAASHTSNIEKTVKVFFDIPISNQSDVFTEGGILVSHNLTLRGIGLIKNNPLKIQGKADFVFENCIFFNEKPSPYTYFNGVPISDERHFKDCLVETELNADYPNKIANSTLGKYIRQFSNMFKVTGFDFNKFVQKNVDLSLVTKNISNCNVLKLYKETVVSGENTTRVLYHLASPTLIDTVPASNVLSIVISDNVVIVAQPNDITQCVGGTQQLTFATSGGTGNITYQWQVSDNGITFTNVVGATSVTYTPPATTEGTKYYRVVIASDVSGCGPVTSTSATVVTLADPTVTVTAERDVVCDGDPANLKGNITGGVGGAATYQWQVSRNGTTWVDIAGATDITYNSAPQSTDMYYRLIVRQTSACETTSPSIVVKIGACNGIIGDKAWLDCNKNGTQESDEIGLSGVPVTLTGTTVRGVPVSLTTTTSSLGVYQFKDIKPGKYRVTFGMPNGNSVTGLTYTVKKQGSDIIDSDVDGTGKTDEFVFAANQVLNDIDAGYKDLTAPDVTKASDLTVTCDGTGNQVELQNWLLNHGGATAVDNLSTNLVWTHNFTSIPKGCGGAGEVLVTFSVADECGNISTTSATFKIVDNQGPTFVDPPKDIKLKCNDAVPAPVTPSVKDVCDANPSVTMTETKEALCGVSFKVTRKWTAKDACGNITEATQVISMEDTEPPALLNVPTQPITIKCSDEIPPGAGVLASDNCDGNPRVTMSDLIERGVCGSNYRINRIWTAIDVCGNVAKGSQTIIVGDYDAPVITGVPADVTLSCGNLIAAPPRTVQATDNCSVNVILSVSDKVTRGMCPDQYSVARTWTATDACGNVSRKTQNITIRDDIKPDLIGVPMDAIVNVYAGQRVPLRPTVVGTDNCDSRVDVTFNETTVNNLCGQTIKRVWVAVDNCQNTTEKTQIITVRNAENLAKVAIQRPESCNEKNGYVELSPSISTYSYKWSDGKTGYLRTDLSAGTYKVTATSSVDCSIELTIVVTRECDCERPVLSLSKTDVNCTSPSSGGATINIANALATDLKFIWTNSVSTTNKATNLTAGNYTVRVERLNKPSCFSEINFTIGGTSLLIVKDPVVTASGCNTSVGKIEYTIPVGDTLVFKWADGNTSPVRTGLAAGKYAVTITRPNSGTCPLEKEIEVSGGSTLKADYVINRQPTCGLPNGSVTINTTGGSGNYKYSWGEGNSRFVLPAGPLNVTVTDVQTGCFTVVSFTLLNQMPKATVTMDSSFMVSCPGMSDGRVTFSVDYGVGFALPAKFEIRESSTNGLYANGALPTNKTYSLMVKDSAGCLANEVKFKIVDPPVVSPNYTYSNQTCDSLGKIYLKVTGGTGGYKYSWADLAGQANQPESRENLKAGYYTVTVTDAAGCQKIVRNIQIKDSCLCRLPVVDSLTVVNANCGSSNGAITIRLSGGTESNYTYTWTPASGTVNTIGNSRTGLAAGTYSVIITSKTNFSCSKTVKVGVGTLEGPKDILVSVAPASCEAADGSASLSSSSGTYVYKWLLDDKITSSRNDLKAGVYQVQVSKASDPNCYTLVTVTVGSQNTLSALGIIKQTSTCGEASGIAAIRVKGGSGQYSFSSGTDSLIPNLKAGVYTVTVTDVVTKCKLPVTFTMNDGMVFSTTISMSNSIVYLNCAGATNGRANYKVLYGTGFAFPADVSIINSNGRRVGNDSLTVGSYCIIVKDALGCVAGSTCFEVKEPAPLSASFAKTDKTCNEGGTITLVKTSGGTGSYQYAWSDLGTLSATADRTNLSAGSYTVTVYDSKGCSFIIDTFKVVNTCTNQPDCSSLKASATAANKTCTEGGKITLNITGGTTPYSVDWADMDLASNPQNRNGLDSGSFSVTITDAAGCKTQLSNIVVKNTCSNPSNCTPPVIGDCIVTDATCNQSNGQITVSVLRPTNVTYKWTSNISTTNIANNVPAGIYKVKVMTGGDSACVAEKDIIVKNQNGIAVGQPNIIAATCGANNGKVEFPSIGKLLIYSWSDGKTGSVRSDLFKGTYFITVTDPSGQQCKQFVSVDVPATNTLVAVGVVNKKAACGQATGQATVRVVGGSGSYSYSWGTTATKADLKSGVYTVTVTDNQTGCQTNAIVTMTDDVSATATVNVAQSVVYLSCAGENNGSVVYNVSYGAGFAMPSRIVFSDNLGRTAKNDSLAAGRYTIFVYDNNNCLTGMGSFEVREPQVLSVNAAGVDQTCTSKGKLSVVATGGSGMYSYKWSDLTGLNQPQYRTEVSAGTYTVTVMDSKGCSKADKVTVLNGAINCQNNCDMQVNANAAPRICTEGGKISVTIFYGSGTYGFQWSDLGSTPSQSQSRTGLKPGTYAVTVTDSVSLCKAVLNNIIVEDKAIDCPIIKCTFIARADVKHETCTEKGSITTTPLTGTKPYTYDWLDLQGINNPQNRFNLLPGQYTLIITDSVGCKDTLENIAVKDSCLSNNCTVPVIANISVNDASCFEKNGSATIAMSGTKSYMYKWLPNVSNTNTATGLQAGVYAVRISNADDTLCYIDEKIVVSTKTSITLGTPTIQQATCGISNGSITVNGDVNWTYKWSDGAQGRVRSNVAPNTYYVSVTDTEGNINCPVIQEIVVKSTGSLTVSSRIEKKPSCGNTDGQVSISVSNGSGNYTYSWGSAVRSNLKAGTYEVTVYDVQTGCSGVASVVLTEDIAAAATVKITTTRFSLNCKGDQNGKVDYTVSYATGFVQPATEKIVDEAGTTVQNGTLKAGKYKIIVTDANGCTAGIAPFELSEPAMIGAQATAVGAGCTTLGSITLTVSGGAGGFTYDWADVTGTNDSKDRTLLNAGTYNVTLKDVNGCSVTIKNIIVQNLCQSIKPKRDTVNLSVIIGKTDSICLTNDPAFAGQTLTHTFCNGSSIVTSSLGTANLNALGCVVYKAAALGTDQICVRSCNSSGVCDTTIVLVKIVEDPSGCRVSYNGSNTISVTRCDIPAVACTRIPYSQLANYTVTDNGQAAQFSTTGCQQDTLFTYSYYTLVKFYPIGPWELDSWVVNGKVFKALRIATMQAMVDSMNVWDKAGNWTLDPVKNTISGGNANTIYGNMVWKRSGRIVATFQPNRQFVPTVLSLNLVVGSHELVFTDKVKGCKDSTTISVICNAEPLKVGSYTISKVLKVGQKDTICFNNWAYASQTIIRNVCVGSYKGYAAYAIDDNNDCIRVTGVTIGRDSLCMRRCYANGQCDTVTLVLAVQPVNSNEVGCTGLYTGLRYFNVPCGTKAKICTNLSGSDTLAFNIVDNGIAYKNGYFACAADTTYSYSYYSLILSSPTGPWRLDSWIVNGSTFTGIIPSMTALVDSMNKWDAGGNWVLNASNYTIRGGKSGNNYGNMTWSKNNIRISSFGPNRQFVIRQVGMYLEAGSHKIVFNNLVRNCQDTAEILVECRMLRTRPSMLNLDTTIFVNETGKYCIPANGVIASSSRIAPLSNTRGYVNYVIDDQSDCIVLTGANSGVDTISLQRCDFDGECDTIKLAVTVLQRKKTTTEIVFKTIQAGKDSTYCVSTLELSGKKYTLRDATPAGSNANVSFIINGTCVTYFGDKAGVDTARLVVCDELGICDTTNLIVYVIQERGQALPTPIAIRDRATTAKATNVLIKPMDNDSLFGLPSNIIVLTEPTNGRLSFDPATNSVVYNPIQGSDCVNRDSFRYAVINMGGKDTAEVAVEVLCDEIAVFSGFSPNGDGVNDSFTILGLEKYPNHTLYIFTQRGNQVYQSSNYKNDWDGTQDGVALPDGTYFWILDLGNGKKQSGYVQIHR